MVMSEKARESKRAYNKEWARKNPDKVRAIQNRYWEKRLAKMKAEQEQEEAERRTEGE